MKENNVKKKIYIYKKLRQNNSKNIKKDYDGPAKQRQKQLKENQSMDYLKLQKF